LDEGPWEEDWKRAKAESEELASSSLPSSPDVGDDRDEDRHQTDDIPIAITTEGESDPPPASHDIP